MCTLFSLKSNYSNLKFGLLLYNKLFLLLILLILRVGEWRYLGWKEENVFSFIERWKLTSDRTHFRIAITVQCTGIAITILFWLNRIVVRCKIKDVLEYWKCTRCFELFKWSFIEVYWSQILQDCEIDCLGSFVNMDELFFLLLLRWWYVQSCCDVILIINVMRNRLYDLWYSYCSYCVYYFGHYETPPL